MDLNLDTLKQEILEYLEHSEFAIFRGAPGGLEGLPMVLWDVERYPDYQMFLDTAHKTGAKMILFASREFDSSEIDESVEELEECDLSREERRDLEARLRDLRVHEGVTCSLELAFDHHARMYVYEIRPDWYDEFLSIGDEIAVHLPAAETEQEDDGSIGYFSNN
ncbi:MAG TPA: hypothetical protein VMG35_24295 [Bryobacteraceae bacterium]|nr:hypothetical protein [Bryobacteraceae bacterium]